MTTGPRATDRDPEAQLRVRLYVAGTSPNSVAALANLRLALGQRPAQRIDLEVIDVLADPERGLRDGIMVTPMLVRVGPLPERRVLGSLRDDGVLLGALGLDEVPSD